MPIGRAVALHSPLQNVTPNECDVLASARLQPTRDRRQSARQARSMAAAPMWLEGTSGQARGAGGQHVRLQRLNRPAVAFKPFSHSSAQQCCSAPWQLPGRKPACAAGGNTPSHSLNHKVLARAVKHVATHHQTHLRTRKQRSSTVNLP